MATLTLTSAGFNSTGKFGQSLNAGYGNVPALITALGSYTVETWFKTTSTGFMLMCGQASVFWIGLNGGQVIARYGGTAEIALNGPGGKADGNWHHAELTFGPAGAKLFVDGVLYDTNAGPFSATGPIFTSIFGVSGFGDSSFAWTGELDEVAVWSAVRHTATFTAPTSAYTGSESNLLALWHLDGDGTDSAGAIGTATGSGAYTEAGDTGSGFGSASTSPATGSGGYTGTPDTGSGSGFVGGASGTAELFLFAGQSNAGALGTGGTPTGYATPDPNIRIWTGSAWATYTPGSNSNNGPDGATIWGPEAETLRAWRAANPGKIAWVVKFTAGGTQLEQIPTSGYTDWSPASSGELYASLISHFSGAKANLEGLGYAVAPRAIFWTQGENDALGGVEASHYQTNLTNLIAALRTDTGNPTLKLIGGRLPAGNSTWPYRATVNAGIDAVDAADALVTYVNTDDLGLADTAHYNSASSQLLGSRYYSAYAVAPAAGTGNYTEASDTGLGSGASGSAGSGSATEGGDNALGSGASGISGSGSSTEGGDTGSGSGLATSGSVGSGGYTETAGTGSGSGSSGSTGSGGSTEAADTASGSGLALGSVSGSGSYTEQPDTASGSGQNAVPISGGGTYSEPADTGAGLGSVPVPRTRPIGPVSSTGIDRRTGQLIIGFNHVRQSMGVIFTTRIGERAMRRTFGSNVPGMLGKNLTKRTVLRFAAAVIVALDFWEPRFAIKQIGFEGNTPEKMRQGGLRISLVGEYRPRAHLGDFTPEGAERTIEL